MWETAKCEMPKSVRGSGSAGVIKLKVLCQSLGGVHKGRGWGENKSTD